MSALLLLLLATAPAAPAEAVLARGETLEHVASRAVGDVRAASELRALNGLPPGDPPVGTTLKLPGPERARARSALDAAHAAVRQREEPTRQEAEKRLVEAESLFTAARYHDAAKLADEAWAAGKATAPSPQRFAVAVEGESGTTRITNHQGPAVRVEAQGVIRAVREGHTLVVERGRAPPVAAPVKPPKLDIGVPAPLSPASSEVLRLRPLGRGLEPVTVRWSAVAEADGYVVRVQDRRGRESLVRTTRLNAQLPSLGPGSYRWSVRAVKGDQEGEPSVTVRFTVEEEPLTLEVKGSGWK